MNNKFWNAPAWSMGHRSSSTNKKIPVNNPGPGNYNLFGNSSSIGGKFGTSYRNNKGRQNQPGPGNYNVDSKNNGPKISMGKKYNGSNYEGFMSSPGPGQYDLAGSVAGKGVTLGSKYSPSKLNEEEPGPGAYNINYDAKLGIKIGSSQRIGFGEKNKTPGPGQYTYDKRPYSAGPKYGFGRSQRNDNQKNFGVGPGSYDICSTIKQHDGGCTMGQRFNSKNLTISNNPGPGDYDLMGKRPSSGAKIGKAKRGGFDSLNTPGPGSYGQDQNYKSMYGTKIGTGKRSDLGVSGNPGPGAYNLYKQGTGGITISGHKGKSKIIDNPGPGAYDPNEFGSKNRPGSAHIGKSQRSGFKKADTPGPGQYYNYESTNYKFAHTKEPRSKQMKKGDPGPGQYDIPPSVPSAPHYLIDPSIYLSGGSKV